MRNVEVEEEEPTTYTEEELNNMTVAQLKEVADSLNVSYTSTIRKADLISAILENLESEGV